MSVRSNHTVRVAADRAVLGNVFVDFFGDFFGAEPPSAARET